MNVSRDWWDERAALHGQDQVYDTASFLAGSSTLYDLDRGVLGDLAGQNVVHLQCHTGMDTLSLLRAGARRVTGVDFSAVAVAKATGTAAGGRGWSSSSSASTWPSSPTSAAGCSRATRMACCGGDATASCCRSSSACGRASRDEPRWTPAPAPVVTDRDDTAPDGSQPALMQHRGDRNPTSSRSNPCRP